MSKKFQQLTMFILAATAASPSLAWAGWESLGTYDDVAVSRKEVAGIGVFAFKGVTTADIHIGKILSVFLDRSQRRHWVDRYEAHTTLKAGVNSEVYWIHFGLPFPVSDRDYVLQSKGVADEEARVFTVRISSVDDPAKPEDDCCVRALAYGTYYRFEAIPNTEKTRITVEVHTNPMGLLPDWLVNLLQKKWPSKTLSALIERARKQDKVHADYADWHTPYQPPPPPPPAPAPAEEVVPAPAPTEVPGPL